MSVLPDFTPEEQRRYLRHLILPEFGEEGQRKLKDSKVLVIGCGGLGSPALMYLAAAGVGTLGFCDFDIVNETNLQRQILFGDSDLGKLKVAAAERRLAEINPLITLRPHPIQLSRESAFSVFEDYDLIVDGSDNFATRYLVNDACVLTGKPYVYGSVSRFEGQISLFGDKGGACYRCLFPEPPPAGAIPSCAEAGVLGVLPGIVGTMQGMEAIKHLTGIGETLRGKLLLVDTLMMRFHTIQIPKDRTCPVCGDAPTITELQDYKVVCGDHPDDEKVPIVGAVELRQLLNAGGIQLIDVREIPEWNFVRIAGAKLMPLSEFEQHLDELDPRGEIVVMCRSGNRSADVTRYLLRRGFPKVRNLDGGILAWRREIDPTMPEY